MSGILQAILNGIGSLFVPFTAWTVIADSIAGVAATASLTFNTDGSITAVNTVNNGGTNPGSASWFRPVGGTPGNNYFIRYTPTVGTFTSNAASSFVALSSNRTCSKSATTGTASVTFTIEIATDSGGTNIVFTSTGNVLSYIHS